ncbi:MAG: hypothetical protein RI900_468 [Actinomycetota bacterium]
MTPPVWRGALAPLLCVATAMLLASCDGRRPATPVSNGEPVSTPAPASAPATTFLGAPAGTASGGGVDEQQLTDLEATLDEIDRILAELDAELADD